MLVLRSQLLLLNCAQRLFERRRAEEDLQLVERKRDDLHRAEQAFRAAEARPRSSADVRYWVWVYSSLIDLASAAVQKLPSVSDGLSGVERFEIATDIQMLEELLERWRAAIRTLERDGEPDDGAASSSVANVVPLRRPRGA